MSLMLFHTFFPDLNPSLVLILKKNKHLPCEGLYIQNSEIVLFMVYYKLNKI